ncbi:MAG: hypothetical protein C0407_13090 [Desulfobacca sp.]|nr:hypothetical protein [Desulfobacca sp.]
MREKMEIIREYEQNGFCERMHLFLQFRDLRDVFQEMEHKESEARKRMVASAEEPTKRKHPEFLSVLKPRQETTS